MLNRTIRLLIVLILSTLLLTMICCDRHSKAWGKMDLAENLMESKPDSSLAILDNISQSELKGNKESARYALLKSIALNKNFIDTTTFDIINPAVVYYEKHGSPDEKFRTYYYSGRIYQNQGNDDSAMQQFMNAIDLKNEISDSLLLARNYIALGTLYFKQYKIEKFIENSLAAAKLYKGVGKELYEIMSYANALDGYIILNDKIAADSIISICSPIVHNNPDGKET